MLCQCTGTDGVLYWYVYWYGVGVARRGYRSQDRQLTVFVSLALHGRLRAAAAGEGRSLQEFVEGVLRGVVEEPVVEPVSGRERLERIVAAGRPMVGSVPLVESDPLEEIA